jgi:plastocyanin
VNVAFEQTQLTVPADTAFPLEFANNDNGIPHNVQIKDEAGTELYITETYNGVATKTFEAPALAAGAYQFLCSVHPNMKIDVTAQ